MTTLDLTALKRVAEAATQYVVEDSHWQIGDNLWIVLDGTGEEVADCVGPAALASHIAAFDPPTCLALIARAEQADALEAERDEARADANAFKSERDISRENGAFLELKLASAEAERDRLKAQVSTLEDRIRRMMEHGVGAAAQGREAKDE